MATKKSNMEEIKSFEFELKTNVKFGIGEFTNLGKYLKECHYSKIGIVVDFNVFNTPYVRKVFDEIHNEIAVGEEKYHKTKSIIYSYGEPTYNLLEKWRNFFNDTYDCIVGIGGGSVIDFAKGLAFLATNKKESILYKGFPKYVNQPLPVIAIPTTAGTGSEVTYNAVFVDRNKHKLGINTKTNYPVLSILDPKLIQTCSKHVMISSGLDALTHAVESYGATKANDLTLLFSEKALQFLMTNLIAITDKTDINVCADLQLAAYYAGIALPNSGSGPAGAMSYVLGPKFNISHGIAGAIFLPHIIKFNELHKFKYPIKNLSSKVFTICDMLNVPYNDLRKYNVKNGKDIMYIVKHISTMQKAFDQNPVPFNVENAKDIIRDMIVCKK